jgi:hypothetical protein
MVTERFHRDDEGRPLREIRTPAELLRPDDIEHKQCPYSGGRHHHVKPMNVSSLRQASAHWDEILDALDVLRSAYVTARAGSYRPDLMDLWRVSQLGSALPWWFILRGEPLPAYAAALSKTTLGMGIWAQQLLMRKLLGMGSAEPFTPAAMLQLAEDTATLIGPSEVCAGSEKMLLRYFEGFLAGGLGTGPLADLRDDVLRFGAHYANFKLVMWLYYLARRYLLWDLGGTSDLLQQPVEPPDFFVIEPPQPANVPPLVRKTWFGRLAAMVVPFAGDDSDAPFAVAARRIADVMGEVAAPATTFATLDAIFLEIVRQTEGGLGGDPAAITTDITDFLIAGGTRAFFTNAAPG